MLPLITWPSHRALQEAQEIFGGDFDFADFDADAYDQGEEEEEDQDEEGWDRPKKQTKRRQGRKSIFEIYEPSELESSHMTDQDNEIRSTDMPERFQVCVLICWVFLMLVLLIHFNDCLFFAHVHCVYESAVKSSKPCILCLPSAVFLTAFLFSLFQLRSIPVKPAEDDELEEEAEWIFRHGFSTLTISMQVWLLLEVGISQHLTMDFKIFFFSISHSLMVVSGGYHGCHL